MTYCDSSLDYPTPVYASLATDPTHGFYFSQDGHPVAMRVVRVMLLPLLPSSMKPMHGFVE